MKLILSRLSVRRCEYLKSIALNSKSLRLNLEFDNKPVKTPISRFSGGEEEEGGGNKNIHHIYKNSTQVTTESKL